MNKQEVNSTLPENTNSKLLQRVIENAFDFLGTAIDQFKVAPKYSIISFCAAVELILKARLLYEHWSLIVSAKDPDIKSFKNGNFKSIAFKDIIPRIESVTGKTIPKDIIECFNELANHRNKMIHFFYETYSEVEAEKRYAKIAIEQCLGWFFLRKLLKEWNFIFSDYKPLIDSISYKMQEHKIYIETVFMRILPEITKMEKAGLTFKICNICQKQARQEHKVTENIYEYKCRVCLIEGNLIRIPCPGKECKATVEISNFNLDEIKHLICGHKIDKSVLMNYLSTADPENNEFDRIKKNCGLCFNMEMVIPHHDYYICMGCLFITKNMQCCDWCNQFQIGGIDLEMSHHTGCNFCKGYSGEIWNE